MSEQDTRMTPERGAAADRHARHQVEAALMASQAEVAALRLERDEAREWVRRMHSEAQTLTCVYCGHAYPPGTPASGSGVLTEHIRVCEKHPLRAAEAEVAALREDSDELRRLLWLRHGCLLAVLYGDDGEMQCSTCRIDFKRATGEQIAGRFHAIYEAWQAEHTSYAGASPETPGADWKGDIRCACERSDAWKCARLSQLSNVACQCSCHRYIERQIAAETPGAPQEPTP